MKVSRGGTELTEFFSLRLCERLLIIFRCLILFAYRLCRFAGMGVTIKAKVLREPAQKDEWVAEVLRSFSLSHFSGFHSSFLFDFS